MKMRTILLSGIAGLAVAGAVSFGAQAQTDAASPPAAQTTDQTPDTNATGGQTPATAPSAARVKQHYHHRIYHGQSGPQELDAGGESGDGQPQPAAAPAGSGRATGDAAERSADAVRDYFRDSIFIRRPLRRAPRFSRGADGEGRRGKLLRRPH